MPYNRNMTSSPKVRVSPEARKLLEEVLKKNELNAEALKSFSIQIEKLSNVSREIQKLAQSQSWIDEILSIRDKQNNTIKLFAEIQEKMFPRDLANSLLKIQESTRAIPDIKPLIVSQYLSSGMIETLKKLQVSYADLVGNVRIQIPELNLFIDKESKVVKNPYRMPDRPRKSLRGAPAIKVLQELIRTKPPVSLPQITKLSGSSTGVVYRLLEFLESEALITKNKTLVNNREVEKVIEINWQGILQAWARDYKVLKDNKVTMALDPRGLQNTIRKLEKLNPKTYAVTGTVAANQFRNYGSPSQAMIYTANSQKLIEELGLSEIENGSNVILLETKAPFIFDRSQVLQEGFSTAPIAQIAVDLLSGPGRNPEVGNELIKWMSLNSQAWMRND